MNAHIKEKNKKGKKKEVKGETDGNSREGLSEREPPMEK